jgi:hypothetical protein
MITQPAPPQGAAGIGVQAVAQLVAATACGLHRLNDHFVRVNATVGDDGYIDVEATRVNFTDENVTVRVLLYPTAPVPIPPRSVPEPRDTA